MGVTSTCSEGPGNQVLGSHTIATSWDIELWCKDTIMFVQLNQNPTPLFTHNSVNGLVITGKPSSQMLVHDMWPCFDNRCSKGWEPNRDCAEFQNRPWNQKACPHSLIEFPQASHEPRWWAWQRSITVGWWQMSKTFLHHIKSIVMASTCVTTTTMFQGQTRALAFSLLPSPSRRSS